MPPAETHQETRAPFAGQLVVFTGKLASLGRREAQALVRRLGGAAADEVTSRTTMLVIGAEGYGHGSDEGGPRDASDRSRKLKRAEEINDRVPGRILVMAEPDFCALADLPSPESLRQQYYGERDIRAMYPAVRPQYLRYLEKWGLIRPVLRTNADRYFSFGDLVMLRQVAASLGTGLPFRSVLRSVATAREGQLALDFRPARSDAQPAKVIALPASGGPTPADVARGRPFSGDPQSRLATRYFLEGAELDEGDARSREQAVAAYRKALVLDPDLVPALVNLANIHYGQDELVEAQALYERAIGLDAECFEAHFNLANIHHDLGRYENAALAYRCALALNPEYADAHFYLAVTLEKVGRSAEAKTHWRAYQRLAPDGEWADLAREFSD